MALTKIAFKPGIDKEGTEYSADSGWFDGDKIRFRKGRVETFDLRPLVDDVHLEAIGDGQAVFFMRLSAGQNGNVRPDAVLAALGLEDDFAQFERTRLLFEFDSL